MIIRKTNVDTQRCNVATAAKVFLDHEDFIRKVISFHIHDEDQADDLFQDFFLFLIRNPLPRDIQDIESHLYRAITNDITDAVRRKEQYRDCLREYVERAYRPGSQKTPVEAVLEMDELSGVFELIEKNLPRTEAQAVSLKYRDGHDAKEIAKDMGVGIATARGYVSEGLSRIRRLLGDNEPTTAARSSA